LNQSRRFVLAVLLSFTVIMPVTAQNRTTWERRPAQIYSYDDRGALTLPSSAAPAAVVEQFLTSRGHDAATAGTIAYATPTRDRAAGTGPRSTQSDDTLTHVRADQRVEGLVVYGSYIKAALNEQGQLVHLIENLAPVSAITRAAIDEQQALEAAIGRLYPLLAAPRQASRAENGRVLFNGNAFFYAPPAATRVLASMPDGLLHEAFLVETWTNRKNLLHHTLVSGQGEILHVELRTNSDQYFVYLEDPGKEAAQTLVSGPTPVSPAGTVPSPNGWLTGTQKTTNIVGNNVRAYLDVISNNSPDSGGTTVSNGSFTTVHNRTVAPGTTANRAVAVQNLFYLNNRIHDILYTAGFNESELNFQTNNFSRGGIGNDAVNAEAQDGGGIDNANFATPSDGAKPRMQMYLWTGKPSHQVVLGSSLFSAAGAAFGPALTSTGKTGALSATSPADGCTAISTVLTGKIAIIDRGTCDFVVKVKNAQLKGAVGVIVANHAAGGDSLMSMGGTDSTITIPAVFVGQTDGATLKAAAGTSSTIRLTTPAPLQRDGDLDSDIVYHEYGHGLTWRMIGSMSGPMSGAIGEGMSDVLAVVLNGDDRVGEYSASDARGIRSAPYTSFPRTYGSVTGAGGVHFDGEVYGAIGWKLRELYLAASLTETDLLRDLVQGMRFTPAAPNYQQMRDGILTATTTNDCKVWTAFALYGVGSGATSSVSGSTVTVTESFTIPAGVCP
jgi:extracellular elastinolytic metalloproteinase